ncbi:ankyrin unc44 [Colletotrichum plurivorum]|uniref:Ankyrin unc44 n=1 Tax=Colletotrichum plurivorum TaxID=2175906 RepID=A0A8H6JU48_9PEZI|nr:ankyrin unc44 [Colletotrichum plurivorum]
MARLLESLPETTEQPTTHVVSEGMTTKVHQADQNDSSIDFARICTPRHGVTRSAYLEFPDINGLSALLCACDRVQTRAAEFLLDHGADIRAKTRTKFNVFHFAAREGGAELIKVLSSRSRRVEPSMIDARNRWGYTPLQGAVAKKSPAAAIALLEAGAQPGLRPVGTFSALTLAIANGCEDLAELLITTYGVDATEPDNEIHCAITLAAEKGWLRVFQLLPGDVWGAVASRFSSTLLHCAAGSNQVEFIKALLSLVPDLDLVPRNSSDQTPWHIAANLGALDALAWISKAMPSALLIKGFKSRLPIHEAALHGHLECVKVLLTAHPATINAGSIGRTTPLALAAYKGHSAIVEHLAENGVNIDATDDDGETCASFALRTWNIRIVKYLLGRGADCRAVDHSGDTLLSRAATTGDVELVKQLLDNECDPLVRGFKGRTALMKAVLTGWSEVTKLLLFRNPEASEMRDDDGRTCIHLACSFASPPEILQTLLDHNPELLLSVDHRGFDAMDIAVMEGRPDLVAVLVDNGMPLTGSPESPWSPMDLAGFHGGIAVLNDLIKRGVGVNNGQGSLEDGGDGLTHASYLARDATATLLFQQGADPTLKDIFGLCALDYASNNHVLQKVFASPLRTHQVMDRKSQLAVLRQTIVDRSKKLNSTKSGSDRKLPDYGSDLEILAEALLLFRTESSVRHSKLAFRALLKVDNKRRLCDFCYEDISSAAFSLCRDYRRGHAHIQVADLKSVSEENEQYIDSEGVLHQRFYEDIARYYSDLRLDEITDFIESESAPPSESEIAEEYENLRSAFGPKCAAFLACFISQESAKKELDKAFNEIWPKARPLLQQLENSDGNDVELEDVKRKVKAYEIAWSTAQAILHVPPENSLQGVERYLRQVALDEKDAEKRDEANLEELETMKSPQRTFTIESRDEYDTASERSARESWKSAGEYLENDQVSDGSGDDQEIGWETCSES